MLGVPGMRSWSPTNQRPSCCWMFSISTEGLVSFSVKGSVLNPCFVSSSRASFSSKQVQILCAHVMLIIVVIILSGELGSCDRAPIAMFFSPGRQ